MYDNKEFEIEKTEYNRLLGGGHRHLKNNKIHAFWFCSGSGTFNIINYIDYGFYTQQKKETDQANHQLIFNSECHTHKQTNPEKLFAICE